MAKRKSSEIFQALAMIHFNGWQHLSRNQIILNLFAKYGLAVCQTTIGNLLRRQFVSDLLEMPDGSALITISDSENERKNYTYKVTGDKCEILINQ